MSEQTPSRQLQQIVQARPSRFSFWLRLSAVLLFAAVLAGGWLWSGGRDKNAVRYTTEEVARGKLTVTVSATGTLQPTNQVDMGSELSGTVEKVLVDENDHVKRGQVLAQLDVSKLNDQVTKSQASLIAAQAQVQQMQATVAESSASLSRLRKVAELSGGKVPSKTEMDSAEAALLRAQANEASARAAVAQAQAALRTDQTNLAKASIRSPINGIVLVRKIEPGQTVAASLQTPVLFTLAENLAQMQLQVNVDEADVGQVRLGQPARFSVDAWPGRKYPADILRVDYGSQTTADGVVSYKTILNVHNDDLTLRPGMTATAEITTAVRENALLIPNAALRFNPSQGGHAKQSGGIVNSLIPRPPAAPKEKRTIDKRNSPHVWVLREGRPVRVEVKTGVTDGRFTEVLAGALEPGMGVITEAAQPQK